jgi:RNA polymerase sigma factor (sigma-70 family)
MAEVEKGVPMARSSSSAVLRQLHTLFSVGTNSGLSDRQLLERFVARRGAISESAFTVLVQRHGPMVLGVCRRFLADPHDADDAFQATFLVLVRKAGSVRVEGSIGGWLFGVATRVAARARASARRRRGRERSGGDLDRIETESNLAPPWSIDRAEIRAILAEELGKLPARFQAAVLLCDLQGWSHEEAARRLGWPVGTLKSRLSRARVRLRGRLTRRGLTPGDLSITIPLLAATPPRGLVETTARAAESLIASRVASAGTIAASVTSLTEGVLKTMFLTKLKFAAVALFLILTGSAVLVSQATAQKLSARIGSIGSLTSSAGTGDEISARDEAVEVEMLERAWISAIPRRDAAIIGRIMADDFEGIDPVGNIFTKATYMPDLRNGVFTSGAIELDELKTRIFGDTAVVTSRIKIAGYSTRGRMTNVYVKRKGRWQCVASHASGLAPATCPVPQAAVTAPKLDPLFRWISSQPQWHGYQANYCTSCHSVTSLSGIQSHAREAIGAAITAGALTTKPPQAASILVETGDNNTLKINGEPVPAEQEALVKHFREALKKTSKKAMVLAVSADTPYDRVALVYHAALAAGLTKIDFKPTPGSQNTSGATLPAQSRGVPARIPDRRR